MNTKSVRFRLTVWYSLAFFLAAGVIFGSFYFVTKQTLYKQTDSTINLHANKLTEVITNTKKNMHQMMARDAFLQELSDPGMVVILTDNDANVVGSSFTLNPRDKTVASLYKEAVTFGKPVFINQTLAATNFRFQVRPLRLNGQLEGVLLVGHPIDIIDKSLTNLLLMLGFVLSIFMIPTIIGGYLLAQSAMQPITAITEKLKKISSENLDERVATPKTDDEVKELAVTFNGLLDRLSQAFKRERQFIEDIAHELKTPLATQRMNIEVVLSRDRLKGEYKKTLAETLVDNNRITTTVKNILDLAWSEAENARSQFEVFDFSELMVELKDMAVKMSLVKQIRLSGVVQPHIMICGKRDKLFHALFNIVDNALKYTNDKGVISLNLHTVGNMALVEIKDNGIGMTKNDLTHIFERFYRGTNIDIFGSGLGLAITLAIITAHHGKINVISTMKKGTSVSISLPRL